MIRLPIGLLMLALLSPACSGDSDRSPPPSDGSDRPEPSGGRSGQAPQLAGQMNEPTEHTSGAPSTSPADAGEAGAVTETGGLGAGGASTAGGTGGDEATSAGTGAEAGDASSAGAGGTVQGGTGGFEVGGGISGSASSLAGVAGTSGGTTVTGGHSGSPASNAGQAGTPHMSAGAPAGGTSSAGGSGSGEPSTGDPAVGAVIVLDDYRCTSCHGTDLAGSGVYPNLTSHPTRGLGAWTDAQIARAIRAGVNEVGETMCPQMPHYPFDDQKMAHVVAYLRTVTANAKAITAVCPGHGQ